MDGRVNIGPHSTSLYCFPTTVPKKECTLTTNIWVGSEEAYMFVANTINAYLRVAADPSFPWGNAHFNFIPTLILVDIK